MRVGIASTPEPFARRYPMMRYRGQEQRRFSHNNLFSWRSARPIWAARTVSACFGPVSYTGS